MLGAIAAVGVGLQVFGQLRAARDQSNSLLRQAEISDVRANEVLERNEINNTLLREELHIAKGNFLAARGTLGESSTYLQLENMSRNVTRQIDLNTREAEFEANMIRLGADIDRREAKDRRRAGRLQAFTTAAGGLASIMRARPGTEGGR